MAVLPGVLTIDSRERYLRNQASCNGGWVGTDPYQIFMAVTSKRCWTLAGSPRPRQTSTSLLQQILQVLPSDEVCEPDFDPLINTRKRPALKKERRRVHPSDVNTLINGSESQIEGLYRLLNEPPAQDF